MPKTAPPGEITVRGVGTFIANALPDPFDSRDLEYRPRLEPLPASVDQRTLHGRYVMFQQGQSCTGHAVGTLINAVLARASVATQGEGASDFPRVSPYMLYRLGRRYDEFQGEEDAGSSLRGVFKGWFHHGVSLEADWPSLEMEREPDLDDPEFARRCADRPLGAFYRVNAFRLDDMQSAINELNAIAVSALIHDGWEAPVPMVQDGREVHVIARRVNGKSLGGHAFAIVGYNDIGFLVQNSWGTEWGKGGYATLPYEDWLDSAYDAWVARPGVPRTPFASGRTRTAQATGGALVTAPGPDLRRLSRHVVNLGNDGFLSTTGKFVSTPAQIERIFEHMDRWHTVWRDAEAASGDGAQPGGFVRHVVLYAHGGLTSEAEGLETAQKHLNWWLNNKVYPIYFAWQSGPVETLLDQLTDVVKGKLPFGLGFDFAEQVDRLVEKVSGVSFTWMWDQMKQNARAASKPLDATGPIEWPPQSSPALNHMARQPGASLTINRLAQYVKTHGQDSVRVHLVGHSAGSIFLAPLLVQLKAAGLTASTMAFLAAALRVDEFESDVLPHLGSTVKRFASFALSEQRELDDSCGANGITVYQKSLLYLVSRALERPGRGDAGEVPLVGMERFFDRPLRSRPQETLRRAIMASGGASIFSRSAAPDDSRSDAVQHGWFDDDTLTMTSAVMRMRGVSRAQDVEDYVRNAALRPVPGFDAETADFTPIAAAEIPAEPRAVPMGRAAAPAPKPAAPRAAGAARGAGVPPQPPEPLHVTAAVNEPGTTPVAETREAQTDRPVAPHAEGGPVIEVADAPETGSPVLDLLTDAGWQRSSKTEPTRAARRRPSAAPRRARQEARKQ